MPQGDSLRGAGLPDPGIRRGGPTCILWLPGPSPLCPLLLLTALCQPGGGMVGYTEGREGGGGASCAHYFPGTRTSSVSYPSMFVKRWL